MCKTDDFLSLRFRGNDSVQYQNGSFSHVQLCCPVKEGFEVRAGLIHLPVCVAASSLVRVVELVERQWLS